MFEKFTSAGARDFQQRYQGTYGFYRDKDKPRLLTKINFVEGIVSFQDRKGVEYTLNPDRPGDIGFEFLPPKSGFHNTPEGAYYVERRAQRQFQRGISDRNVTLYLMRNQKNGGFRQKSVAFTTLEMIYESNISYTDAWKNFTSGKVESVAISPQIALTDYVFVFAANIGKVEQVDATSARITLTDKDLFRTEISDAFRALNVKVTFQ